MKDIISQNKSSRDAVAGPFKAAWNRNYLSLTSHQRSRNRDFAKTILRLFILFMLLAGRLTSKSNLTIFCGNALVPALCRCSGCAASASEKCILWMGKQSGKARAAQVIFCRKHGFSDEIRRTKTVDFHRKTGYILPIWNRRRGEIS